MLDVAKKTNTEYLLNKYHLNATKKFGQNFLVDLNVVKKMVNSYNIDSSTCVIEIGPGIGALTEQLAHVCKRVIAFEIDTRLKDVLKESVGEYKNVEIIFQDFLTVDLKALVNKLKQEYQRVEVIANLPYYITSDLLEYMITSSSGIDAIHAMVQQEVADKLTDIHYKSPLTLMIESVGTITKDMKISRNVFLPAPHVDSAIISVTLNNSFDPLLKEVLTTSFNQKRKTIYNNLKEKYQQNTTDLLESCHILPSLRPQELTVQDYLNICNEIRGKHYES